MGTVVKFGRRDTTPKPAEAEKVPQTLTQEEQNKARAEFLVQDVLYYRTAEGKKRIGQCLEKTDEITNYIFSMAGFYKKDESVELRQNALKTTSLEQLCDHVLGSTSNDWNTKPHFFGACILEIHERLEIIGELYANSPPPAAKE